MNLQPLKYIPVENLQAAEKLLKEHKGRAAVIAGGTDLMGTLKDAVHASPPDVLIGLKPAKANSYVKVEPSGIRIGALTTLNEIIKNPVIQKDFQLLAQSAASVASPQIRNVGTIAGNICQEPRCWYYRNPDNNFDCLRKGGQWCDALFAENRYHSIFGGMCVSAAPCETGCPIHNAIPEYMEKIREGKVEEAAKILLLTNPLAAITGRVCSHYCEEECNRNDFDESVSIRNVERYLGDFALEHAIDLYQAPAAESGKSVAVVGSGPAGLTTAYFLRKSGHIVTVFERMPEAGGMLRYSIPEYRLPKEVVLAQVKALEGMGIKFKLGTDIGDAGLMLKDLQTQYQSVFLSTGLWIGKNLKLENSELLGSGLEFLIDIQKGVKLPIGRRVLVIGGGSVAVDVALSAKRLGASQVTMVCLESFKTMPAVKEDVIQAQEEGIKILPSWGPKSVTLQNGKLTGMEFVRCVSVFDKEGHFAPSFNPEELTTVETDEILVAIGQAADLSYVESNLQIDRGMIAVKENLSATTLKGVFAGGDVTGKSATVVHGMVSGKNAATAIDSYLSGKGIAPSPAATGKVQLNINAEALETSLPGITPELSISQRKLNSEDKQTISSEAFANEAKRCANCGCVAVNASDLATALIALDAEVKTTTRTIKAEDLFAATMNSTTVLAKDELIEEFRIPTPNPASRQSYHKFRIRNSIDFPIISVAFRATIESGRMHDVRMVLGAVSPVPLRVRAVEELLEGQVPDALIAAKAAELATRNVQPLARNKAKVEILKALINRAILTG